MLSRMGSLPLLLLLPLLPCIAFPATCVPIKDRAPLVRRYAPSTPDSLTQVNSSTLLLDLPSMSDPKEYFEYKIKATKQVLNGRLFTRTRIRPDSLHHVLEAGLGIAESRLAALGNIRLADHDNPFVYRVPGCDLQMASNVDDGEAKMTYSMMREVFRALELLLEKGQRYCEVTFLLSDDKNHPFGHGEIFAQ